MLAITRNGAESDCYPGSVLLYPEPRRCCGGRLRTLDRAALVRAAELVAHAAHELAGQQRVGQRLEHGADRVDKARQLVVVQGLHRALEDSPALGEDLAGGHLALSGECEQLRTPVRTGHAQDQALGLQPLGQLDGAGVRDPQPVGQVGDRAVGVPEQGHESGRRVRPVTGGARGADPDPVAHCQGERAEDVGREGPLGRDRHRSPRTSTSRSVRAWPPRASGSFCGL